jgi:hypothetical protein
MPVRPAASRRARRAVHARWFLSLTLACAVLATGCGIFSPRHKGGVQPGVVLPPNTTPHGAIDRLQRSYENQQLAAYEGLLTADFRYTFSAQSDPKLAAQYADNWGKDDETESAKHLFEGFVDSQGKAQPAASNITVRFDNDQYYADPAHSDSTAWYVYCPVSNVNLTLDLPQGDGTTTTVYVTAPHSFYLVRGDAALLDAGQPADSTRWYVRHWDDLSPATPTTALIAPGLPVAAASWGGLRGSYGR